MGLSTDEGKQQGSMGEVRSNDVESCLAWAVTVRLFNLGAASF